MTKIPAKQVSAITHESDQRCRNVVNADAIAAWTKALAESTTGVRQVQQWITTVLRRWIIRETAMLPVERCGRFWFADGGPGRGAVLLPSDELPPALPWWQARGDELLWSEFPGCETAAALRIEVRAAIDYLDALRYTRWINRLDRMSVPQVLEASRRWYAGAMPEPLEIPDDPDGIVEFHAYTDGCRWVELKSAQCLMREGKLMAHCVGEKNYRESVAQAHCRILSLRGPDNYPWVTVEVRRGMDDLWCVIQIKGRHNLPPVDGYHPHICDLVERIGNPAQCETADLAKMGYYITRSERTGHKYVLFGVDDLDIVLAVTGTVVRTNGVYQEREFQRCRIRLADIADYLPPFWGITDRRLGTIIYEVQTTGQFTMGRWAPDTVTDRLAQGERLAGDRVILEIRTA